MKIKKKDIQPKTTSKTSNSEESWLTRDISIIPYRLKDAKREYLYSQLDLLIRSGFDLRSSLELLIEESSGRQKELFDSIYQEVVKGKLLSEVLETNSHFSAYEYESIKIGEESGAIEDILKELGLYYQRKIALRRKFVSVMMYPIIVLLVSFGVIYFMLNVVVPMFEDMFKRFDSELPPLTRFVISVSESFSAILPWLLLAIVIGWVSHRLLRKNKTYIKLKEKLHFSIPVFGKFVKKNLQSRFTQNMRLLLAAHTPLVKSLQLTGNMLSNEHYREAIEEIIDKVSVGGSLHQSMKQSELFEARTISLIRVGEEVNKLDLMFDKLNLQMGEEMEHQSKQLSSLLEPFIIITLGLIVGVILVAMYLPILNLSTIIS